MLAQCSDTPHLRHWTDSAILTNVKLYFQVEEAIYYCLFAFSLTVLELSSVIGLLAENFW